ncbi:MAG: ADOP family duplicated permease [Acidobacteriaceae bacterium]
MKLLAWYRSVAAKFFHRSETADDIDEELRTHIQHRADDLGRSGLTRAEAERRARIEFGGYERYKEESHEALGGNFLETLQQDVRFSLRTLRKSPGFTFAAIATLALAIGANAVVFGIMDALVLRPVNVPQPESLWAIEHFESYPNYVDLRDRNRSFDGLAAWKMVFTGLDTGNNPASAAGYATSGNYFDVLELQPSLGRFFHSADEHGPNSAPYIVLTWDYWHSRFHDDPGVVGRTVQLSKHPFTIIGVAPRGFYGTLLFGAPDFFMPIVNQEQVDGQDLLNARGDVQGIFETLGHLKPGVTPAQATTDLKSVAAYLERTYPKEVGHRDYTPAHPGLFVFGGPARAFLAGLMLLAGLILLAACANLGSLFGARAADRSREIALRLALGSSRRRILRQLLTEAVLLSLAGGTLGLLGSVVLLRRLSMWQPFPTAPMRLPVAPDAPVYWVALILALVSGLLFGIVPVRQVMRANPYEVVKAGSSGRVGRRITVRDVLLVVQIAICAVLVTSSLVAVRGLERSLHSHFGFDPRNAMVVNVNLPQAGYSGDQLPIMEKRIVQAMEAIPGVQRAGLATNYPPLVYAAATGTHIFKDEARDLRPGNAAAEPYRYDVSPGYLEAAGTALLVGRDFSWHDDENAPRVALVNRELARKLFGSAAGAVGRYYKLADGTRVQIVGVIEDGKYLSMTEDQESAMFLPFLQSPPKASDLIVRSNRDPKQTVTAIRTQLHQLDPGLPADIDTWNNFLGVALFPGRVATMALGVMGLMGGMLSITGIFGMAAYSVSKRLRELGIRIALGAQRTELLQAALGRALKLLTLGSAAGLVLGLLATRVLGSIVYGATPRDPVVLGGVVLAMALLGLLATWIPAQRALSLDPLILLREE